MSNVSDWLINQTREARKSIASLGDDLQELITDATKTVNGYNDRRHYYEKKYEGKCRRNSNALRNWSKVKLAIRGKTLRLQDGFQNVCDRANTYFCSFENTQQSDESEKSCTFTKTWSPTRYRNINNMAGNNLPMFEALKRRVDDNKHSIRSEDLNSVDNDSREHPSSFNCLMKRTKYNLSKALTELEKFRRHSASGAKSITRQGSFKISESIRGTFSRLRAYSDQDPNRHTPNIVLRNDKLKSFPFCEDFDGKTFRKTSTISESIQAVLEKNKQHDRESLRRDVEEIVMDLLTNNVHTCQCGATYETLNIPSDICGSHGEDISSVNKEENSKTSGNERLQLIDNEDSRSSDKDTLEIDSQVIYEEMPDTLLEPRTTRDSPHVLRRLSTATTSSLMEQNYLQMKCFSSRKKFQTKAGAEVAFLRLSIQQLLVTNRLKITVNCVEDMRYLENGSTDLKTFVKACIMPRNKERQKRTKKVEGSSTVYFKEDIYFDNISIEETHLVCLRLQVYQKKPWFARKMYRCVGETFVWLDDLDVVGKVDVSAKLDPYLSSDM